VSFILSELGVVASLVKIDKCRCLLVFDQEEDFRRATTSDGLWWVRRGVSMTPWMEDLVIQPLRDVWIRCSGAPFHVRCPSTLMAIGKHWGDVLMVEFGTVESCSLDDGRILISTDVEAPLHCGFKLMVDGKEFTCRMMEDWSTTMERMQQNRHCSSLSSGQGFHREDHRILGSLSDSRISIIALEEEHKTSSSIVRPTSADGDVV
ncbi:hypothetical protein Dimus_001581, partial [Dionaea muscipula]